MKTMLIKKINSGSAKVFVTKLIAIAVLIFIASPAEISLAKESPGINFSLDDKIKLVDWLKGHVTKIISNSISEDKFIINVTLNLDIDSAKKEFNKYQAEMNKLKNEIDRKLASNDLSLRTDSAVLYLDKLGIWAENINQSDEPDRTAEDYFSRESLEKYLKVNIIMTLDTSLTPQVERSLVSVLRENIPLIPKANLNISVKKVNLISRIDEEKRLAEKKEKKREVASEKKIEEKQVQEEKLMEKLKGFQLSISAVLGILSLIFVFLLLMRKWSSVEQAKLKFNRDKHSAQERRYQDQKLAEELSSDGAVSGDDSVSEQLGMKGYEDFKQLCDNDMDSALLLVKKLINSGSEIAQFALNGISRNSSLDILNQITADLDIEERKSWGNQIVGNIGATSVYRGGSYIASELIESAIMPSLELEKESRLTLTSVNVDEFVKCADEDEKFAAVLVNILPTIQVGRALSSLDVGRAKKIARLAVQLTADEMSSISNEVKKVVLRIREQREASAPPFVDKSIELIREAGPLKEDLYFDTLAASGGKSYLMKAATAYFPTQLIGMLPESFIKTTIDSFPLALRAETIFAVEGSLKAALLNSLGEGSKLRELIDVEIKFIEEDPERKSSVQAKAEQLTWKFVKTLRKNITQHPQVSVVSAQIVEDWVDRKIQASGGGGEVA